MIRIKLLFIAFVLCSTITSFVNITDTPKFVIKPEKVTWREWALYNYGEQVKLASKRYDIPFEYLMALIVLESKGQPNVKPRFESHIYDKLQQVKSGTRKKYEDVTKLDLESITKKDIQLLASSVGPLQLMGLKSIQLGICIEDLYGDSAIFYAAKWISEETEYMEMIQANRFTDAFHIHNTGHKKPKTGTHTYDPNYCKNGMNHLKWFKEHQTVTDTILLNGPKENVEHY